MFLSSILDEITPQLRNCFPDEWKEIAALAITRTIRNVPIKYVKDAWEKLYLSTKIEASLSRNTVSEMLRTVGADWDSQSTFFSSLIKGNSIFYFDLSSIFSRSVNLNLAEKRLQQRTLIFRPDQLRIALFARAENAGNAKVHAWFNQRCQISEQRHGRVPPEKLHCDFR